MRDRRRWMLLFGAPIIQLFLFGYVVTTMSITYLPHCTISTGPRKAGSWQGGWRPPDTLWCGTLLNLLARSGTSSTGGGALRDTDQPGLCKGPEEEDTHRDTGDCGRHRFQYCHGRPELCNKGHRKILTGDGSECCGGGALSSGLQDKDMV